MAASAMTAMRAESSHEEGGGDSPVGVAAAGSRGGAPPPTRGVGGFSRYADYLDAQVTEQDLAYLGDESMARMLVELGYRASGHTLKRAEFEAALAQQGDAAAARGSEAAPRPLACMGAALAGRPFLQALAAREEALRAHSLT